MTATLTEVRRALASTLGTISGLNVHAFKVGSITPPTAVVMPAPGDFAMYQVTMDPVHDLDLVIGLFVQWGDDESASEELDPYISPTDPKSIWAAVHADQTLGGVVVSAQIETARSYGSYTYGGQEYYGVEFPISIML
jgi:hypothetical protein